VCECCALSSQSLELGAKLEYANHPKCKANKEGSYGQVSWDTTKYTKWERT
jgi:hypothetical protein